MHCTGGFEAMPAAADCTWPMTQEYSAACPAALGVASPVNVKPPMAILPVSAANKLSE